MAISATSEAQGGHAFAKITNGMNKIRENESQRSSSGLFLPVGYKHKRLPVKKW